MIVEKVFCTMAAAFFFAIALRIITEVASMRSLDRSNGGFAVGVLFLIMAALAWRIPEFAAGSQSAATPVPHKTEKPAE